MEIPEMASKFVCSQFPLKKKIRGRQSSEPLKEDKTNVEQEKLTFWV